MTLAMAVRREDCIVVGADRLSTPMGLPIPGEPWGTEVRKIALDSNFPIGAVMFGVATVDGIDSAAAVEAILNGLPSDLKRDPRAVSTLVAATLHRGVRAMRASAPQELAHRVRLEIAMGFWQPTGTVLCWIEIADNVRLARIMTGVIKPTEALEGHFANHPYIDDLARFGPSTEGEVATIARVHAMLTEGVAEEERLLQGVGIKAGIGVDVAVIDRSGARLWDPAM